VRIGDYYHKVLIPANVAVSAMRRLGMPISMERARLQDDAWQTELQYLESFVEKEAGMRGIQIKYSEAHSPKPDKGLIELLYGEQGLNLNIHKRTATGLRPSTDEEALKHYAAVGPTHRENDLPIPYTILKIRSIAKAKSTHLGGLMKWRRADGCAHPKFKWMLQNTTRLSASDPPAHQLPERADPEIAEKVKACIVPRVEPWLGPIEEWDPRKHGWVAKADVKGAEAIVRAGCIAKCRVSIPYLRSGGDIHSKTASILYKVAEGTYKKGTPQRDDVGKQSYFLLIFGGSAVGLRRALWKEARMWLEKEESEELHTLFFTGYPDLLTRYHVDTELMFGRGYIEDFYGRRWAVPPPAGMFAATDGLGHRKYHPPPGTMNKEEISKIYRLLENRKHIYANRSTQTSQATTTLWWIALCILGEYVELVTPECLEGGNIFPEAKGWTLNGGSGPGGRPFQAWTMNTVHDSLWSDGAPGYLEPFAKLVTRRCNGVPADFLLENDMPWRCDIEVGPDLGNLRPYNKVAAEFGLEPMPNR